MRPQQARRESAKSAISFPERATRPARMAGSFWNLVWRGGKRVEGGPKSKRGPGTR